MPIWFSLFLACGDKDNTSDDTASSNNTQDSQDSQDTNNTDDTGSEPTDPAETDADQDGIFADEDCDDENPWVSSDCGRTCTGDFEIIENDGLAEVAGCAVIEGELNIDGISQTDLIALNSLESVTGSLWLFRIDGLESLRGLNKLESVGDGLIISYNESLTTLSGLEALHTIDGTLSITSDQALTDMSALSNLKTVGGSILIDRIAVDSFEALGGLETIGASFYISECSNLTSIRNIANSLQSFGEDESIGTYDPDYGVIESLLYVYNNASLCESEIDDTVVDLENMGWEGRKVSFNNSDSCK